MHFLFVISIVAFGVAKSRKGEFRKIRDSGLVFPDEQTQIKKQFNLSIPVKTSSDLKVRLMSRNTFLPRGCDNSDYCIESEDYPDIESVKEIVKNFGNSDLTQLFFHDPLETKTEAEVSIPDVSSRLNPKIVGWGITTEEDTAQIPYSARQPWDEYDLITETPLCHTISNYVFPKTAKTRSRQSR